MDLTVVIVLAVVGVGIWLLARRGETRRLHRMATSDADALRRAGRSADQGWSRQYRGHEGSGPGGI